MKERPMLFSGPMVRAILDGRKAQTRRIINPQPKMIESSGRWYWERALDVHGSPLVDASRRWWEYYGTSPYGKPGDRLWVRESIMVKDRWCEPTHGGSAFADRVLSVYCADGEPTHADAWPWKRDVLPSIHCPRGLSRLTLEVTGIRVERLQEISEDEAKAEGALFTDYGRKCGHGGNGWREVGDCPAPEHTHPQRPGWSMVPTTGDGQCLSFARSAFANFWDKLNEKRAPWHSNPWVWVVEFRQLPTEER